MKIQQVREMKVDDLKASLKDNYEALENLRFQHATNQLENYKSVSNTKKDIAKILTIMKEKDLKINENLTKKKK
ncbi:MAG: 50S ribosomal protein L29 [Ignavibacteria bacterium]